MAECRTANGKANGRYDVAVIGAGSAGFAAAIAATEQGAQVALIGHGTIGGTCVNVGCVPSKTLIRAAEGLHRARAAGRFAGIVGESRLASWPALIAQKDELVAGLRQTKYADLLRQYNKLTYLEGRARLVDGGVAVNGSTVQAPKIVIATGARPALPDIPGMGGVRHLTSTSALALPALPRSMLVIGGGYVGCELAQLFARAGVTVTIVSRRGLLPEAEPEISSALARYFADEGIRSVSGVQYRGIAETAEGVALSVLKNGKPMPLGAETVLVAAGRTPNVEGLGLAEAGVAQAGDGSIRVDSRMRTTRCGTYAAGDVTGRDQFVYMAAHGAKIAAKNALNGDAHVYDDTAVPAVAFTDPQAARVGLTARKAQSMGLSAETRVLPLDQVPRALASRDTRGLIKLVAECRTGRLLGAHILAPEAGDSIQTAAMAIRQRLTVGDLSETIFPYLTTVEGLKLAALSFDRDVSRLSCCAG